MQTYKRQWKFRPEGWMRKQLQIQAAGLSGNLDRIWPDISRSAWIGGDKDGWERMPYWLDGFVPLAFLLEDEDLVARAKRYVHAIVDRQEESGWICPCPPERRGEYDLWTLMLISKVLAIYCRFTGDVQVRDSLYRAMKNFYDLLLQGRVGLGLWGEYRWFEALIALEDLYRAYGEDWILDLTRILRERGVDYGDFRQLWKQTKDEWSLPTHIVNLAMMFKAEALTARLLGEPYANKAEEYWKLLDAYHGTAVGCFTGDECLSGNANNRGFELCSVVELMYSCQVLYDCTGGGIWLDRLEKIAFNALPAAFTGDMWAHQYDQQVNQIGCVRSQVSFFRSNNGEAHLFGLEPNFGCCTANFSQGWPKLAMAGLQETPEGICCAMLLPGTLQTRIRDTGVTVRVQTDYPFRMDATVTVSVESPVNFALKVRIPGWAEALLADGSQVPPGQFWEVSRQWQGITQLHLELKAGAHLVQRPNGLRVLEYGPLVFALPIAAEYQMYEYEKDGVVRKFPYCDYELYPKEPWGYGFAGEDFAVLERESADGFSPERPPLCIAAKLCPVNWQTEAGQPYIARPMPESGAPAGPAVERLLVPYGCAKLRLTEMPLCDME